MPILPDLRSLREAANIVDATAQSVENDAADVDRLINALPWTGRRREVLGASLLAATSTARQQATAERNLARALRQLAGEAERELAVLKALAERARRHLDDLLRRAHALVERTVNELSAATRGLARVAGEILSFDPAGAVRESGELVARAKASLRSITEKLQGLPEPFDPIWRTLGPSILGWRPQ